MAHQIEQMAYIGATPWHGLGSQLTQNQPIEIWQREAGMDWQIQESPAHFKADTIGHMGSIHSFPEQKVLYRSDRGLHEWGRSSREIRENLFSVPRGEMQGNNRWWEHTGHRGSGKALGRHY